MQRQLQRDAQEHYRATREMQAASFAAEIEDYVCLLETILERYSSLSAQELRGSLRAEYCPLPPEVPTSLAKPIVSPRLVLPSLPSLLGWIPAVRRRYEARHREAGETHRLTVEQCALREVERQKQVDQLLADHELENEMVRRAIETHNCKLDEALVDACDGAGRFVPELVLLALSAAGDGALADEFQSVGSRFDRSTGKLEIHLDVNGPNVVPGAAGYRYIKKYDEIREKARSATSVRTVYRTYLAGLLLAVVDRSCRLGLETVRSVTCVAWRSENNPATGQCERFCAASVQVTADDWSRVDPLACQPVECFKELGGRMKAKVDEFAPVKAHGCAGDLCCSVGDLEYPLPR